MKTTAYHDAVLDHLRSSYGVVVSANNIARGGSHPYVTFLHRGERYRLTLQRDGNENTVAMKLRDIRKLLGEPSPPNEKRRRSLDDMTKEVETRMKTVESSPSVTALAAPQRGGLYGDFTGGDLPQLPISVRAACYSDGEGRPRLIFYFSPEDAALCFGAATEIPIDIQRVDQDSWRLTRSENRKLPMLRKGGGKIIEIEAGVNNPANEDLPFFGRSATEAVLVDGSLLVRLLEKQDVIKKRPSFSRVKTAMSEQTDTIYIMRVAANGDVTLMRCEGQRTITLDAVDYLMIPR